ncbi:hypothetical protein ACI48D_10055 [Massilia sp. LXY-6]|uniref:hypothetical protein n=1 Tax=Massilia sp. LXY-6 TaxID=3379823 RepID=UPI003EE38C45
MFSFVRAVTRRSPKGRALHALVAVACYLCGAAREANKLLDALRGEIHVLPWAWIAEGPRERSDPGFVHDRIRRELART